MGDERVDHLLGVVPGGPRVPQTERRHPVGVDVLGGPLQLGEGRDGTPARIGLLVVDLEQERFVRLDDEGSVHARPFAVRVRLGREIALLAKYTSLLPRGTDVRRARSAPPDAGQADSSASSATPVMRCRG
ncbi:hypothetical protein GCM10020000_33630 [Streptomyces olivoverticillatus]